MRNFLKKYGHAWTLLYVLIYMPWFAWLEASVKSYTVIHVRFDDMIPFCEYFVIPYFIWFAYVPVVMMFVFFTSKKEFYQASAYLFIGMTICLLICTIWPNGQDLRITDINGGIFADIVKTLYTADTNTNVFPSIHVFNSVGVFIILCKSEKMKKHYVIKTGAGILSFLIILSTMFLKQHSIVDVIGGIILGIIMYVAVYVVDYSKVIEMIKIQMKGKRYKEDSYESRNGI